MSGVDPRDARVRGERGGAQGSMDGSIDGLKNGHGRCLRSITYRLIYKSLRIALCRQRAQAAHAEVRMHTHVCGSVQVLAARVQVRATLQDRFANIVLLRGSY